MIIMGGDFNSAPEGGRLGYSASTESHRARADRQFTDFIRITGGTLVTSSSPTRRGQQDFTQAALDHLLLWEIRPEESSGITEWTGDSSQDHGKVSFAVDPTLLGPSRPAGPTAMEEGRKPRLRDLSQFKESVDAQLEEEERKLLQALKLNRIDASEAVEQCLHRRQTAFAEAQAKAAPQPDRRPGPKRLPHRNPAQQNLLRVTRATGKALQLRNPGSRLSLAETQCLNAMGLPLVVSRSPPQVISRVLRSRGIDNLGSLKKNGVT